MDTFPSPTGAPDPQDWSGVVRGELVTLRHPTAPQLRGVLEMRNEDASVVWIRLHDGGGRRLVHHSDGFRLHRG